VGEKSMIIVTVCSYPQAVDNFGDLKVFDEEGGGWDG
jgi:hypothetical protein